MSDSLENMETCIVSISVILNKYKRNVHMHYQGGYSPLHLACYAGHEEVAGVLLKADPELNAQDQVRIKPDLNKISASFKKRQCPADGPIEQHCFA